MFIIRFTPRNELMKTPARCAFACAAAAAGIVFAGEGYQYIIDPGDPVVRPTAAYSEECSCILSLSNGDVSTPDEMEARYRTVDYSPCIPLKSTPSQGMFIYVR